MAQSKTLSVKLSLNDKQFQSALNKSTRSLQRFGNKMKNFGDTMSRNITLPVLGLGAAAVKLASDFEETRDKFNIVFRDIKESANDSAKVLADSFNMSSNEAMRLLANTGDLLAGFGFTQEEALSLATQVNKLAADLSSFEGNQFSAAEASKVLTKALLGERDALVSLGIKIAEEDLKSYAEQKGLNIKELDRITKAQLTFDLALKQSANAIGNIEKTSTSLSNQLVRVQKDLENIATEFGQELIPVAKILVSSLRDLTKFLSSFSDEQIQATIKVLAFNAALGPIISIAGRLVKAFAFLRKFFLGKFLPAMRLVAQVLMNLTPQGRIISGLIVAASFLVTNWGKVKKGFDDLVDSTTRLLEKLGLIKKQEGLGLDFSIQEGEVLTPEEMMRRAAARQGVKIVSEPEISPEVREGRAKMASDKARANQFKFVKSIEATSVALKEVKKDFASLEPIVENFEEGLSGFDIVGERLTNSFQSFGNVLQGVFAQSLQSSEGFFKSFVEGSKRAMSALMSQLAATLALNALLGGSTFGKMLGLSDIGGIGGIGIALKGLLGMANGGLVTGATLAMVGEGPGTSMSNPEVVAPLDKLKSMIGQGNGSVEVFGTISGQDILLSSTRARNNRIRTRGY